MDKEQIVIASDHAAFQTKQKLRVFLEKEGFDVIDDGTDSPESCDYPDYISKAASRVSSGKLKRGIVLCGSGVGASIVANKFPNIRAALAWSPAIAKLVREHNDANILVLPGRFMSVGKAKASVKQWLKTPFSQGVNHKRRIAKILEIEKTLKLSLLLILFLFASHLMGKTMEWSGDHLAALIKQNVQYSRQENTISLMIDYNLPTEDENTELFLDFNRSNSLEDLAGNYKVKSFSLFNNKPVMFRNSISGGFILPGNKVVINTKPENHLNNQKDLESFSISFWLHPTINASGMRTIFEKGNFKEGKHFGMKIFLAEQRINFRFNNFFFDSQNRPISLEARCSQVASLGEWNHYALSYDNTTGKMTLFLNGEENTVVWATSSRQPESEILTPRFNGNSDMIFGGQPFGYIDDFLITRNAFDMVPFATIFKGQRGLILTDTIKNDFNNSKIQSILLNNKPSEQGFQIQIRTSQEYFDPEDIKPDWHDFKEIVEGKYFQVRLALVSDESMRSSPVLKSLIIKTADMNNIEPPSLITLTVSGQDLLVEWNKIFDKRLKGYFVHVKDIHGEQIKFDAGNTTSFTVTDLKDDEDYFISISSYDDTIPPNESKTSKENRIHFNYRSHGNE